MESFTDLQAWQVGIELLKEVNRLLKKFPKDERFGIISQLRKSTTSILANSAEGFGRYTYADKANKYVIARGECNETRAFLFIAVALEYVTSAEIERALQLSESTGKLLSGLISSCRKLDAVS